MAATLTAMVRQQSRVLAGTTIGVLAMLAVVSYPLLTGEGPLSGPPLWLVGVQLAAGLLLHLVLEAVGYRAAAVPPGTPEEEVHRIAVAAFQSRTLLRIAAAESIGVVSLAVAFVLGGGGVWTGYVTGAAVSVALIGVHGWPWSRPIDRTEAALQRDGTRVGLREAFGLPPRRTGAVQEL